MLKEQQQHQEQKRVLVIGFGVSGIIATHTFLENGFTNVTVVEGTKEMGGVWNLYNHYPSITLNNSKNTYEFPEMRHEPGEYDDFPTQEQVNSYLRRYVKRFDLERCVQYDTHVTSLSRRRRCTAESESNGSQPESSWLFDVSFSKTINANKKGIFDVVVLATGLCHKPVLPKGLEEPPNGVAVVHSSQVKASLAKDSDFCKGKRVAVIGGSKSAQDLCCWAADCKNGGGASKVTLMGSAGLHWQPPRYIGDNDPRKGTFNEEILYSRFSDWMLPSEPASVKVKGEEPKMIRFFQKTWLGKKMRDAFWSKVATDIVTQLGIPERLVPNRSISEDWHYASIQHPQFFPLVKEGKINVELKSAHGFQADTGALMVQEDEGQLEDAGKFDVVLCATGFGKSLDFLSDDIKEELFNEHSQAQLFRQVYCPSLPQMGFVGFCVNSNEILTAALAARWVSEMAKGVDGALHKTGVLRDTEAMKEAIQAGLACERAYSTSRTGRSGAFATSMGSHPLIDSMLGDLGSDYFYRSKNGYLDNIMGPILPAQYEGVIREDFSAAKAV